MTTLPLKLPPGSDLRLSIEKVGLDAGHSGFVLGVVGNLSKAVFQCAGRSTPTELDGNLEIITLNGTFSPSGVHLHLSLSDNNCQVWGGHLENGTLVLKEADILLYLTARGENKLQQKSETVIPQKARIEIAVLSGCPWCTRALRILRNLDLEYDVITVNDDDSFKAINQRSNSSTFPQIFIDGESIGGYEALNELYKSGELRSLA